MDGLVRFGQRQRWPAAMGTAAPGFGPAMDAYGGVYPASVVVPMAAGPAGPVAYGPMAAFPAPAYPYAYPRDPDGPEAYDPNWYQGFYRGYEGEHGDGQLEASEAGYDEPPEEPEAEDEAGGYAADGNDRGSGLTGGSTGGGAATSGGGSTTAQSGEGGRKASAVAALKQAVQAAVAGAATAKPTTHKLNPSAPTFLNPGAKTFVPPGAKPAPAPTSGAGLDEQSHMIEAVGVEGKLETAVKARESGEKAENPYGPSHEPARDTVGAADGVAAAEARGPGAGREAGGAGAAAAVPVAESEDTVSSAGHAAAPSSSVAPTASPPKSQGSGAAPSKPPVAKSGTAGLPIPIPINSPGSTAGGRSPLQGQGQDRGAQHPTGDSPAAEPKADAAADSAKEATAPATAAGKGLSGFEGSRDVAAEPPAGSREGQAAAPVAAPRASGSGSGGASSGSRGASSDGRGPKGREEPLTMADLPPISTPFRAFATGLFSLFQGHGGEYGMDSLWWCLDTRDHPTGHSGDQQQQGRGEVETGSAAARGPSGTASASTSPAPSPRPATEQPAPRAARVLGPYSCEQMILAYIAQALPRDLPVCGTRGCGPPPSTPPVDAFRPLGPLLDAAEAGQGYTLLTLPSPHP